MEITEDLNAQKWILEKWSFFKEKHKIPDFEKISAKQMSVKCENAKINGDDGVDSEGDATICSDESESDSDNEK